MNSEAFITVKSLESWKSQIALSNLAESTRSLYIMLKSIENLSVSPHTRYQLLNVLQPTVSTITTQLTHFYDKKDILTENQVLIYELTNGLFQQMFEQYKNILNENLIFVLHPVIYLKTIENSMHYCIWQLFHTYKYHQQPQPGLWLELHQLHILGTKKPLLKHFQHQIENIYKQALLFICANPYRLHHEQIDFFISALQSWAPLLELSQSHQKDALYYINVIEDKPPRYTSDAIEANQNVWFLKMEKVNHHLLNLAKNAGKSTKEFSDPETKLPLPLINDLLATWQQATSRTVIRKKTEKNLKVTPTLTSVHWLMGENHPDLDEETSKRHMLYTVNLVDESETGYCIAWVGETPQSLKTGEILGISLTGEQGEKNWEITVIRWLKQDPKGQITLGLEKLSHGALPISAKPLNLNVNQPIPTLLLAKEAHRASTLITPLLPFKAGQKVELHYLDKTYAVELIYAREQTPSFQAFELDFLDEPLIYTKSH